MSNNFSFDVDTVSWPMRAPFTIANYQWTAIETVRVTLSQQGHRGRGEGVPLFYRKESPESIAASIQTWLSQLDCMPSHDEIAACNLTGAARNAIDAALWDLDAKCAGLSVWQLLKQTEPKQLPALITLVLDAPDKMATQAESLTDFPILKLKLDAELIKERVSVIRAARPDAVLLIDANCSWSKGALEDSMLALVDAQIAMLEQPLPPEDDAVLASLGSPISLCADESCQTVDDLDRLRPRYDMINIKLDKCGGLTTGLRLAEAARAMGFEIMVGNMLGSSLAMAPAFYLAQVARYADLDGPLFISDDYDNPLRFESRSVFVPHSSLWG
ncbi:MAG: dipeptide epimerase [Pseudomonadota bacterium]